MSGVNKSEMYKELEGKSNQDVANRLRSTESREERCEVMSMFISLRKEETGLVGKSDDEARMCSLWFVTFYAILNQYVSLLFTGY